MKLGEGSTLGPWKVSPDYGKENVYRLWNGKTENYPDDTSPEAMDANCRLIAKAPALVRVRDVLEQVIASGDPITPGASNRQWADFEEALQACRALLAKLDAD